MKYSRSLALSVILLVAVFSHRVYAAGPVLTPQPNTEFPTEVQPGETVTFHLIYSSQSGDAPKTLQLSLDVAGEPEIKVPQTSMEGTDPASGINVTWTFAPKNAGSYKYHFTATSQTDQSVRFPATASDDLVLASVPAWTRYLKLGIGLLVALILLPFAVYVGARAANKRGNPATAARVGLLLGIVASYVWFVYLFDNVANMLTFILVGVAMLGVLIALFARR